MILVSEPPFLHLPPSRAKDVTMPAKLPVSFFPSTSPVHDLFLGQLDQAEDIRQSSEISLVFFYAPWCGQSAAVREEIEQVAKSLADQVREGGLCQALEGLPLCIRCRSFKAQPAACDRMDCCASLKRFSESSLLWLPLLRVFPPGRCCL